MDTTKLKSTAPAAAAGGQEEEWTAEEIGTGCWVVKDAHEFQIHPLFITGSDAIALVNRHNASVRRAVEAVRTISASKDPQQELGNEQLARELAERLQVLYGYQVGLNDLIPALLDILEDWNIPRGKAEAHPTRELPAEETGFNEVPGLRSALIKAIDFAEWGWTIIANAGGGDWQKETAEWREAAEKYRDQFHDEIRFLLGVPVAWSAATNGTPNR